MAGKRRSPWAGSTMEEVRSWKWEEMTVVLVGPAAGLEENVRGELSPSLWSLTRVIRTRRHLLS